MQVSRAISRARAVPVRPARRVAIRRAGARNRRDRLRRRATRASPRRPSSARRSRRGHRGLVLSAGHRAAGVPRGGRGWIGSRFGVAVDPDREVVPTLGSKEAIFSFAHVALGDDRRGVAIPAPAYPGLRARRRVRRRRVRHGSALASRTAGFPDLDAFAPGTRSRSSGRAIRTTRPARRRRSPFYEELAGRASEHGFLLCSDEAYSELWFDEPPRLGAAGRRPHERGRVQHAVEALLDDGLPLRLRLRAGRGRRRAAVFRPRAGPRRRSSSSAPGSRRSATRRTSTDVRAVYARKREVLLPVLEAQGPPARGRRGDLLPLARGRRALGAARPPAARARASSSPGLVLRPRRRGLRQVRPRSDRGRLRARGRDPRGASL